MSEFVPVQDMPPMLALDMCKTIAAHIGRVTGTPADPEAVFERFMPPGADFSLIAAAWDMAREDESARRGKVLRRSYDEMGNIAEWEEDAPAEAAS